MTVLHDIMFSLINLPSYLDLKHEELSIITVLCGPKKCISSSKNYSIRACNVEFLVAEAIGHLVRCSTNNNMYLLPLQMGLKVLSKDK